MRWRVKVPVKKITKNGVSCMLCKVCGKFSCERALKVKKKLERVFRGLPKGGACIILDLSFVTEIDEIAIGVLQSFYSVVYDMKKGILVVVLLTDTIGDINVRRHMRGFYTIHPTWWLKRKKVYRSSRPKQQYLLAFSEALDTVSRFGKRRMNRR